MSAGGVFSETLQSITTTKLTELSKKQKLFEDQKNALLAATELEENQKKKLRILVDGVKQCLSVKTATKKRASRRSQSLQPITGITEDPAFEVLLKNLERFLAQAQHDPSISPKFLQDWEASLKRQLNIQSLKYQYATLYGELVTEWLASEQASAPASDASQESEQFEHVRRESEARDESRAKWERLVFEPFQTDQSAITAYLENLFGSNGSNKLTTKALLDLRNSVESFEASLSTSGQFNEEVLRWTIKGLLSSGRFSDEKSAALKDFLSSPVILVEVADVLNMRMAAIDTWEFESDGLPVEQRRHVTGQHHIYIEEDLLQAIFLQYLGVKWSVFFKDLFLNFSNSEGVWTSLRVPVSEIETRKRDYILGHHRKKPSVQSKRQGVYKSIYFMNQLPDAEDEVRLGEEGEEEAEYDSQSQHKKLSSHRNKMVQMAQPTGFSLSGFTPSLEFNSEPAIPKYIHSRRDHHSDEYDIEDDADKPKSPMETKQYLLHILATEILLNTRLNAEITCLHGEFDQWNPSLPHSTVFCVLSFYGLSKRWLRFFRNFLKPPLRLIEDGASATTRIRERGAPGAHALSDVCGEAVLFCLDYAVNQRTNGAQLYRIHDTFWIWSPNHQTVVDAWDAITSFKGVMGVSINISKTGSVRIMGDRENHGTMDPSLPEGEIRWGFLYLDGVTGRFSIDDDMLDKHIEELKRQLQDKKSIFAWIQAWNTYAGRFFISNFGKPANCFGREHVDSMLKALERIQRSIFSDTSVVEYLKNIIGERFGISNIPDGYVYLPASLGGLELHNPFIGLVQLRDSLHEHPETTLDDFFVAEAEAYRVLKANFDARRIDPSYGVHDPQAPQEFLSLEEFVRAREEVNFSYDGNLYDVFMELLQQPTAETVDINVAEKMALNAYPSLTGDYWRWVAQLYGPDTIEKFGGLNIVDPGLLPIGMVNLFREGKVKWQG